jgi:hypothetical protein
MTAVSRIRRNHINVNISISHVTEGNHFGPRVYVGDCARRG